MLKRQQLAALAALVDELSTINDWPNVNLNAPLLIYDVLVALDLSEDQRALILGADIEDYITNRLANRYFVASGGRA